MVVPITDNDSKRIMNKCVDLIAEIVEVVRDKKLNSAIIERALITDLTLQAISRIAGKTVDVIERVHERMAGLGV